MAHEVEADTIATLVVLPVAIDHICERLLAHSSEIKKLAHNLQTQAGVIASAFPELADPLAAIHLDREVSGFVSDEVAGRMRTIADGLDLVLIFLTEEQVEFRIGEEELVQTIAILRRPFGPPSPPPLRSVPTGP